MKHNVLQTEIYPCSRCYIRFKTGRFSGLNLIAQEILHYAQDGKPSDLNLIAQQVPKYSLKSDVLRREFDCLTSPKISLVHNIF